MRVILKPSPSWPWTWRQGTDSHCLRTAETEFRKWIREAPRAHCWLLVSDVERNERVGGYCGTVTHLFSVQATLGSTCTQKTFKCISERKRPWRLEGDLYASLSVYQQKEQIPCSSICWNVKHVLALAMGLLDFNFPVGFPRSSLVKALKLAIWKLEHFWDPKLQNKTSPCVHTWQQL